MALIKEGGTPMGVQPCGQFLHLVQACKPWCMVVLDTSCHVRDKLLKLYTSWRYQSIFP